LEFRRRLLGLKSHNILSRDLYYGDVEKLQAMLETVSKLLAAYQRAISRVTYPKRKMKQRTAKTRVNRY
jgi:hypothetical protein